jgi:hypothetical protein
MVEDFIEYSVNRKNARCHVWVLGAELSSEGIYLGVPVVNCVVYLGYSCIILVRNRRCPV